MINELFSTSDIETCTKHQSILTINDKGVNINIFPFVAGCNITPNKVCLPMPYVPPYSYFTPTWKNAAEPFGDIDEKILTEDSYFICANSGRTRVSISDPGQESVRVGDDHRICDKSELYHFLEAAENIVGPLTDEQLTNVELIIDAFIEFGDQDSAKMAYILSTGFGESKYLPVREGDSVPSWSNHTDMQRGAALYTDYNNNPRLTPQAFHSPHPTTGQYYFGRGFVQLTHFSNYDLYTNVLTAYTGQSIDLTNNPDLVMNPEYSAIILVHGMMQGSFGDGLGLNYHINSNRQSWGTARNTVGGLAEQHYIDYAVDMLAEFESIINALPPENPPVVDFGPGHAYHYPPPGKLIAVEGATISCQNARGNLP